MKCTKFLTFAWQSLFLRKCKGPVRASKLSAGITGFVLWLLLLIIGPAMAAETNSPILTFHQAGKTMTIRASDIAKTTVAPERNSELSYMEYELTTSMMPKTGVFMLGMKGKKIAAFVDGRVSFSKSTVHSVGELRTMQFPQYKTAFLHRLSARLKALRNEAETRDQPVIFMFEKVSELTIMPGEIDNFALDGDMVEFKLDLPADKSAALATIEPKNNWHLSLGDQVIDKWRLAKRNGSDVLVLENADEQALKAADLPELKKAITAAQ